MKLGREKEMRSGPFIILFAVPLVQRMNLDATGTRNVL